MNKKITFYSAWAVLVIIYTVSVFVIQPDSASMVKYHLDAMTLRFLSLAIVLPIFASWFAAVYGLIHIGRYADKIKGSEDGEAFRYLVAGLMVFSFGQAIASIVSRLLAFEVNQNQITKAGMTIVNTHLNLVMTLIGFLLLMKGASKLIKTIKKAKVEPTYSFAIGLTLAILSALYAMATLANPSRTVATGSSISATYYMSDFWIITTIVLPYILVWASGLYTALFLRAYYRNVGGAFYKKALSKLNTGFIIIILSSILLQFTSAANVIISGWGLNALLGLIFALVFVIALGYLYVARGARELNKLEDVT